MFRQPLLFACATALALGMSARADVFSSNVTLTPTSIGAVPQLADDPLKGGQVIQIVSAAQDQQHDVSFAVNTNKANPGAGLVYATGVIPLTNYSQNAPGTGGSLSWLINGGHNYNFVFAVQGHSVPAITGSSLTAQFDKGVFQIFDVGTSVPTANNPATWIPAGSTSVYKATLGPQVSTGIGVGGSGAAGVSPASMQNIATFIAGGNQTPGQAILQQFGQNPNLFVEAPQDIFGFQAKFQETDNATIGTIVGGNAALDAAFQAVMAGIGDQGFGSTTPFTTFAFNPDGTGANGDTVQSIALQLFPLASVTPTVTAVVPEPASMLVWAGIAAGLGIYCGVRRSRRTKSA
jgi:hypothetical protein